MSGTIEPTNEEFQTWLHAVQHALWRRTGLPVSEPEMVSECWLGCAPLWAQRLADQGADPSSWCPQLDAGLRMRSDTVEDELALLLA